MKKLLLFTVLASVMLVGFPQESDAAKKKYRYIKREHGVKLQGKLDASFASGFQASVKDLAVAYAWNFKGMFEVGPYFAADEIGLSGFSSSAWSSGLSFDYNIFKNRGKRKYIPTVGLKVGYASGNDVNASLGAGLKWFPANRTAFYATLDYKVNDLLSLTSGGGINSLQHGLSVVTGISYYFDFY